MTEYPSPRDDFSVENDPFADPAEKWKATARDLCEQLIDGYTEYDVDHVAAVLAEAAADEREQTVQIIEFYKRPRVAGAEEAVKAGRAPDWWPRQVTTIHDELITAIRAREQKP